MLEKLRPILQKVCQRTERAQTKAKTVTLKIKYFDFQQTTRSRTLGQFVSAYEEIYPVIQELLHQPAFPPKAVRLLGISLSNLDIVEDEKPGKQLTLRF